jgi:hypothetical protein
VLDCMDPRGELRRKEVEKIEEDGLLFPHVHRGHQIRAGPSGDGNVNRPKQMNGQTSPCFNNIR